VTRRNGFPVLGGHEGRKELERRLPAGRIETPADIAPAYLFLMENDLTTGTTLHIDGGQSLI
jgi:NAD(P)-dependent dehydrogenase (short-subunit alcohol dehydrogenase family)